MGNENNELQKVIINNNKKMRREINNWYKAKQKKDAEEFNKMVSKFFTKKDPLMKNFRFPNE